MNKIGIIKCWKVKKEGTLAVVIPKDIREELKISAGNKFLVSYDKQKRLVFTRID